MKQIIESALTQSQSYLEYRNFMAELVREGRTSGPNQSEALVNFTKLNHSRMKRWDKTYRSNTNFGDLNPSESEVWLLIVESWCGDAAQITPVINIIAEQMPNVELRLVLRDEHPELMDMFLTNGSRSIPKLIRLKRRNLDVLSTWGARPAATQPILNEYKSNPEITAEMFKETLARWYVQDGGKSVEEDLKLMMIENEIKNPKV